jgi:hypothetical protein
MEMKKVIKNVEIFTQRNNKFSPSVACFPTSAAMALHYLGVKDPYEDYQLEDYLVYQSLNLTNEEKKNLIAIHGEWIFNHRPFQVIPIMEYICKKLYTDTFMSWGIGFDDIIESIDKGLPVVCLGDFSKISYVKGHYNCIVGYNTDNNYVITMDPYGDACTNYSSYDGAYKKYPWAIFNQGNNKSYGLIFTE